METLETFRATLAKDSPDSNLTPYLQALWYDAKGDWHKAHDMIDSLEDRTACWVHAYLHRKEGDKFNANYWYNKARRTMPMSSLDEEWEYITTTLLNEESTA
jgi:hypothetical protein